MREVLKAKKIRHRSDGPHHRPCESMPCPECGACPDCNVCTCGVDFDDWEQLQNYVERIRESQLRACCDFLFHSAEICEKLEREEREAGDDEWHRGTAECYERSGRIYRDKADQMWEYMK